MLKNFIIITMSVATTIIATIAATGNISVNDVKAGSNLERHVSKIYYTLGTELVERTVVLDGDNNIILDRLSSVNDFSKTEEEP